MNFQKRQLLRPVAFLLVLLLLMQLLSVLVVPACSTDRIQYEPQNTLDYIILGDSEGYTGVSPMQLWQDYGYAGFDCAIPGQRIQDTYYALQDILKDQKPQVLLLETNLFSRLLNTGDLVQGGIKSFVGKLVPLYRYHGNWKTPLASAETVTWWKNNYLHFKGMEYNTTVNAYEGGDYLHETSDVQKLQSTQCYYLDRIRALCKKNNIQLIFFTVPSPVNWSYPCHNGIAAYASAHSLLFWDLNLQSDAVGLDWSHDTRDKGDHVNFYGAQKVTAVLGQLLKQNTALPDRRGQDAYIAWDENLAAYQAQISS